MPIIFINSIFFLITWFIFLEVIKLLISLQQLSLSLTHYIPSTVFFFISAIWFVHHHLISHCHASISFILLPHSCLPVLHNFPPFFKKNIRYKISSCLTFFLLAAIANIWTSPTLRLATCSCIWWVTLICIV